jgi:hypothetical protein
MSSLTKLEWTILNNLANDWECPATISPEVQSEINGTSRKEVLGTLYQLFERGLVALQDGGSLQLQTLLSESEDNFDTRLWFGLTQTGCFEWEKHAEQFSGNAIHWGQSWSGNISYLDAAGYVDGTTREVCVEALNRLLPDDTEWEIDRNTLQDSAIAGFDAKYYKYIHGGHRISFKLRKKEKCEQDN